MDSSAKVPSVSQARAHTTNVLVVDDDQDILNWFKTFNSSESQYFFSILKDESKILDTLKEVNPDLIFLDICLTSMSGRKVKEIVDMISGFKIPIVFMSSRRQWNFEKDIPENYFLAKPLDKIIVKNKIEEILKEMPPR